MDILIALAVVIVAGSALITLVLWAACTLSSRISRREEEQ